MPYNGPVIAGYQCPRPATASAGHEIVRSDVELGGGSVRSYVKGRRITLELSWRNVGINSEFYLRLANIGAVVNFQWTNSIADFAGLLVTTGEGASFEAIAGTNDRVNASLTVKAAEVTPL